MVIRSPYPDIEIPDTPLVPFVLRRAAELGDKPAIIDAISGRGYSYAGLASAVRHVAAGLAAHGVRKGDVVGLVSPNTPDFAVVFYAIVSIGAICSTVNPIATAEEIGAQFADSEAILLFTIPELYDKCEAASRLAATVREIVVFGEHARRRAVCRVLHAWRRTAGGGDRPRDGRRACCPIPAGRPAFPRA